MIEKKQKIIELIKEKGPCLPGQLSNEIGLSLLFTSALLSEMVAEKTLKLSFLKIGGSPLYYLEGQENLLEKFIDHLPPQERNAVMLLKEKKVLEDETITPLQRVALRNTKDFAKMIKQTTGEKEKIFWYYYLVPEEEAKKIIETFTETKQKEKEEQETKIEEKIEKKTKKKFEIKEKILENLRKKGIKILEEFKEKNKICKAMLESEIGKIKFLVYAINKKTINEEDLALASFQGQEEKLPVLLVTQGKLTKKASEYLKKLNNITLYKL
ncbi:MAG: hypothetical protein NZ889_00365 [Candidatus Pacearchaeota archaeon]|nr:hypothetical protein [Candidatus Pacearchaeota archaeon]